MTQHRLFQPHAGALRYLSEDAGEYISANPHDTLYSTVTMSATQYWDGKDWQLIYTDKEWKGSSNAGYQNKTRATVNQPYISDYSI